VVIVGHERIEVHSGVEARQLACYLAYKQHLYINGWTLRRLLLKGMIVGPVSYRWQQNKKKHKRPAVILTTATTDGRITGVALLWFWQIHLYVKPEHRRKGVARRLLAALNKEYPIQYAVLELDSDKGRALQKDFGLYASRQAAMVAMRKKV